MKLIKNLKLKLCIFLSGLMILIFQNCGQSMDFKSSLPENSVFVASSISSSNQLSCPDGSPPLLDSVNPCPTPSSPGSPSSTATPTPKPSASSSSSSGSASGSSSGTHHDDKGEVCDADHKEKHSAGDEDKNDHDKIECLVGNNLKVSLSNDLEETHANGKKSRLCMSENACLNLINAYAGVRRCKLSTGAASSNATGHCTEIFPGSKGTCHGDDTRIVSDEDVTNILEKMKGER